MIYLAAPFHHENPAVREARVKSLCEFHSFLLSTPVRAFYYNPLANSIGVQDEATSTIPEAYWVNHGLHMLSFAQALYVLMLPGWEASRGVAKEIAKAHELQISVHYFGTDGKERDL